MSFFDTLLAFIVTIGILVTIHEWGHFIVARLCGVKVLRFSVGFGPVMYSRKDRHNTEFAISAIPLGGYVKMLGEHTGDAVDPEEESMSFTSKPAWQRMAIVAAGPAINLVFALLVFWIFFAIGTTYTLAPVIEGTLEETPAHSASLIPGAEIISVDGQEVHDWTQVTYELVNRVGDTGEIILGLKKDGDEYERAISIDRWLVGEEPGDVVAQLGLVPFVPEREARIDGFIEGSPAKEAGLAVGDQIVSIEGVEITNWMGMAELIQKNAGREISVEVLRGEQLFSVTVVPVDDNGNGKLGIYAPKLPPEILRENDYTVVEAFPVAWKRTGELVEMSLVSMAKMVQGKLGVDNLSGPITIARIAGESANRGFQSFIQFLAFFSVMLGVLNLLPIPALDGGHLLFYTVEAVAGKAVPEAVQQFALMIGLAILVSLMAVAIYNDVMRL